MWQEIKEKNLAFGKRQTECDWGCVKSGGGVAPHNGTAQWWQGNGGFTDMCIKGRRKETLCGK